MPKDAGHSMMGRAEVEMRWSLCVLSPQTPLSEGSTPRQDAASHRYVGTDWHYFTLDL